MNPSFRATLTLSMAVLMGCHGRFKKAAPGIDDIRLEVVTTSAPEVNLGKSVGPLGAVAMAAGSADDSGLGWDEAAGAVGVVVDVAQEVKEAKQSKRLAKAISGDRQEAAMAEGVAEVLEGGVPFAVTTEDGADAVLQLEIVHLGLDVPAIGAQGHYSYTVKARMYDDRGKLVYKSRMHCTSAAGDPDALAVALGTVNNVKQLKDMSNKQIDKVFAQVAEDCGGDLARKMRKHAG